MALRHLLPVLLLAMAMAMLVQHRGSTAAAVLEGQCATGEGDGSAEGTCDPPAAAAAADSNEICIPCGCRTPAVTEQDDDDDAHDGNDDDDDDDGDDENDGAATCAAHSLASTATLPGTSAWDQCVAPGPHRLGSNATLTSITSLLSSGKLPNYGACPSASKAGANATGCTKANSYNTTCVDHCFSATKPAYKKCQCRFRRHCPYALVKSCCSAATPPGWDPAV